MRIVLSQQRGSCDVVYNMVSHEGSVASLIRREVISIMQHYIICSERGFNSVALFLFCLINAKDFSIHSFMLVATINVQYLHSLQVDIHSSTSLIANVKHTVYSVLSVR